MSQRQQKLLPALLLQHGAVPRPRLHEILGAELACASEGRGHCGCRNRRGRGEQGGQAACKPSLLPLGCTSSSCLPSSCGTSWQQRCSLRQGALGLLAGIKQRGFHIHLLAGNLQPGLGIRLTHSFFWMMLSTSAPAALSRQLLFKQAKFFISQTAAPAIRDQ